MGVTEDDLPILKAFVPTKEYKYECDTKPHQLSLDLILKFGRDILQRKISPSLKSQDPVENNGPLTIVVGKNFKQIVRDTKKDVFVSFHSSKSFDSKQFTPTWKKLAESLEKVDDLLIATFDLDKNELLDLDIDTFPALKFYPKDYKEGIDYEED